VIEAGGFIHLSNCDQRRFNEKGELWRRQIDKRESSIPLLDVLACEE
jgi:hypothetical protein